MTSPKEPGQRRWEGSLSYLMTSWLIKTRRGNEVRRWGRFGGGVLSTLCCTVCTVCSVLSHTVLSSKDAAQRWEEIITLGGGGDYNVNCLLNIFSPTSPPPGATCSTWSLPILLPDIRWAILQLGCKTTLLCKSCSITCDLLYGWKPLKMCLRKSFCTIWRWWWSIGGHLTNWYGG